MRRATLLLGAVLTMLVVAGGVAWAANVIQCPNDPDNPDSNVCHDTEGNDVLYGTPQDDHMSAYHGGSDVVYAYKGDDVTEGGEGPDVYYGGPGDDQLAADCDVDSYCGKDEKHGGPGADHIVGNLAPEKHFGGRGNDLILDADSMRYADTIRCGPGTDRAIYNEGLDRVAADCEVLEPYTP